jgi:RNA polymerase-interacting CarD/CdnL/TRCF family regulator
MTHDKAKKQLAKMLRSFTTGSILHLLADLCREEAEEAREQQDARLYEQCRTVEAALIVVGCGVDATLPD